MSHSIGRRYVTHSQAFPLSTGLMYSGEDLSLQREVIFVTTPYINDIPDERYMNNLRKASCFVHNGFLHILDTIFEENTILTILQHKPGKPLISELGHTTWTFAQIVTLIADLGVSMLDAMEEQISGFSVSADNLWLDEDNQLSVIHYWEDGKPQTQGALGLCGLMLQLFTGSVEIPGPYESLETHLERSGMAGATAEQRGALIVLVKRVCQGQASLSSLIFGLRGLPSVLLKNDVEQTVKAQAPIPVLAASSLSLAEPISPKAVERKPVNTTSRQAPLEEKSFITGKKTLFGASGTILAAVIIWSIWPSGQSEGPIPSPFNEANKPVQTATPSVATNTQPSVKPTPSASPLATVVDYKTDGLEIDMPNLVGLTQADAERKSLASRLRYKFVIETNEEPSGQVFKQEPEAGSKIKTGDEIKFWISKSNP